MMKWCFLVSILYCLCFQSHGQNQQTEMVVLVHGGAGKIRDDRHARKLQGVKIAAKIGYKVLVESGSVTDAVESAIRHMEDDDIFNAGYGSVLNVDEDVEMDASIMVGSNLSAGGVTIVQNIANPISLARLVMEETSNVLLGSYGAEVFALKMRIPLIPEGGLVTLHSLELLRNWTKGNGKEIVDEGETVGCVAIDENGHVAAGTSTGGLTGKMIGRCSDSSQIGSGTFADDNCGAVSSTGHGESIIKYGLAKAIAIALGKQTSTTEVVNSAIEDLTSRFQKNVGAIALSKTGEVGLSFSTPHMPWAYQKGKKLFFGIKPKQNETENIP